MKFKIVKGNIVKSDFTLEYEKASFTNLLKDLEKKVIEMTAQKKIYDAKADNVARNHPHVLKLDDEKRNAIWLYQENFVASKQAEAILKGLNKDIKGLKSEMSEITKQTGFNWD